MPNLGTPEILILLLVLVLLFGATRLPKAAEGIGKALKVFKKEVRTEDSSATEAEAKPESNPQALHQQAGGQANGTPQSTSGSGQTNETPVTHQKNS